MSLLELFIIAIGVSMDAFAVAICKGLSMKTNNLKKAGKVGLYFGSFQAIMPLIGYYLGVQFEDKISSLDHWIALILLGIIGINMIKESRQDSCDIDISCSTNENVDDCLSFKKMSVLSIATSIDALAVGVTFAFLHVNIFPAVLFIGIITFSLSTLGVNMGFKFGSACKSKAELLGGVILIGMGINIFIEHMVIK